MIFGKNRVGIFTFFSIWLLAWMFAGTGSANLYAMQDRPIVIRGASIITAIEAGLIEDGAVVIRGRQVEWVGKADQMPVVDEANVIDAHGKYVIPGLIDAHVHLFDESQLPIYLANGITTVFNMTGTPRIQRWAAEIRSGSRVGPTIYTTGPQIKDEQLATRLARPEMRYFDPMLAELWKTENNEYRNLRDRKDQFAKTHAFHQDIVKGLHDSGVALLAGTDAGLFMPTILPGFSMHRELELLVKSGLTPNAALRAATAAPGAYLEPGSGRGQIRSGAPADLVLLNKNPLRSIKHTRAIHAVVASGMVLSRTDLDSMLDETAAQHAQTRAFADKLIAGEVNSAIAEVTADQNRSASVLSETGLLTAAYIFSKNKELEKADQLVRLARMLHPDSYLSAFFHSGLFSMANRKTEELQALQEVLRLEPQHMQVRLRLNELTALKDRSK